MATGTSKERDTFIVMVSRVRVFGLLGSGPTSFDCEDEDIMLLKNVIKNLPSDMVLYLRRLESSGENYDSLLSGILEARYLPPV